MDASKIKAKEWMSKSSDAAPMNYSMWRYLKQQLNRENVETLEIS